MPIQVFADESGGKGQGGYLAMVGVIGTAEDWTRFSERWRAVLDFDPPIKSFHMIDAAGLQGEFKGWSHAARDERVRRLAGTVNDFAFTAIHCSVDMSAFAEIVATVWPDPKVKPTKKVKMGVLVNQPYFACFNGMIFAVCTDLSTRGLTERFDLFLDKSALGEKVIEWYPVVRDMQTVQEQAIMPLEPLFRDDRELTPLQLADLLAWIMRKVLSGQSHTFGWLPEVMPNLAWSRYSCTLNADLLREAMAAGKSINISEAIRRADRLLGFDKEPQLK